jgi:hypothetical protein
VRRLAPIALCLVLAACTTGAPSSTPTPGSTSGPSADGSQPGHAEERLGRYRLAFDLPRTTWNATEAIAGQATLELVDGSPVQLSGSGGGLLVFEFAGVDTRLHVQPVSPGSCMFPYPLAADAPIVSPITKSGAYSPDQPDASFYASFFADPIVHLPPGEWEVTAIATFEEVRDCGAPTHAMRATVHLHVTP